MAEKTKAQQQRSFTFSLPVSIVVLAIAFIYASTVFVFIDRWLGLFSSPGIMNVVVFTVLTSMCAFTYRTAISSDPGRVPSTYVPDVEDVESPIHEIKRKGGDLRYCQKCNHYKPPRAHHCRVCKRCVLRMDHHCIWINNCVGHANYKILLVGSLAYVGIQDEEKNGSSFRTVYVVSSLLLVSLSIALCVLFGWHIYLILHNKTTIEYREGVRALWLAEKGGRIYKHPYDIGPYENLTSVLGPNILSWLWPTSNHIGSGLRFRTVYDLTQGTSTSK
ncbi:probable protein S-acyltransferase 16 isoform X3 [Abrus precatorius]|uniref:S-acyltransferase n=1 Tax=Abrus precatorius TaxID=3816 RepID=A0A8B8JWV1_ABRPR|nr:probable protein S-acyltransferase 16 isoform X3 [Abrus precatorius]